MLNVPIYFVGCFIFQVWITCMYRQKTGKWIIETFKGALVLGFGGLLWPIVLGYNGIVRLHETWPY